MQDTLMEQSVQSFTLSGYFWTRNMVSVMPTYDQLVTHLLCMAEGLWLTWTQATCLASLVSVMAMVLCHILSTHANK